jgi:hypothetical protein
MAAVAKDYGHMNTGENNVYSKREWQNIYAEIEANNELSLPSVVQQLIRLKVGESYSRAEFIPAHHVSPQRIRDWKRTFMQDISPVIARAKKACCGAYHAHTIHSFTRDYDVVVAIIVVREEDVPL